MTSTKKTLYDMVQEMRSLIWLAEENEGVLEDDTLAELTALEDELPVKANAIISVIEEMTAQSGVYHARGKKLMEYAGRLTKQARRLKGYLQENLESAGYTKCPTDDFPSLRVQNNPPRVEIIDANDIHADYFIEAEPRIDKRALLEDIKAGKEVAGAELVQTKGLRW